MTAHARLFPPSSADRTMTCTASVMLIERLRLEAEAAGEDGEDRDATLYAAEGTAAHQILEWCLSLDMDAFHFEGMTMRGVDGYDIEIDTAMVDHIQEFVDWVNEQPYEDGHFEKRIDLSNWVPDQFGTLDIGLVSRAWRRLTVADLKYGAGVEVSAEGNRQLRVYALGLWWAFARDLEIDEIQIVIFQPRFGGMKSWTITFDELMAFGKEVDAAWAEINSPQAKFAPSEKACRWCPIRRRPQGCAARNRWLIEALDFESLDDVDPELLDPFLITPARRARLVQVANGIRKLLSDVHEASLEAALYGNPDPGLKAVVGQRGDRKFTDGVIEPKRESDLEDNPFVYMTAEEVLVATLGDAAYAPRKLVSPAQAEDLMKPRPRKKIAGHPDAWAALQELVIQAEGKPILVPEDDARLPVKKFSDDDFEDLPDL